MERETLQQELFLQVKKEKKYGERSKNGRSKKKRLFEKEVGDKM